MKVVYTAEALRNLEAILEYIAAHLPAAYEGFEARLNAIERRIGQFPHSAREVIGRPGVRVVPMLRYPYKFFYQVNMDVVEILHIHHGARQDP